MREQKVELMDILNAREYRAFHQQELLNQYNGTLICFTMNIAGPIKNSDLIYQAFKEGMKQIELQLRNANIKINFQDHKSVFTGNEANYMVASDPETVKKLTVEIEEYHSLGRFFDIDVLDQDQTKVERKSIGSTLRKCLLCNNPVLECSSRRTHSIEEIQKVTNETIEAYFNAQFK